ncbi:MAG TPA: MoaD/ThiS family protein [Dehalococcoidia bacterium]|nr:MoaD/ThiS family protein [Dehalococcoidia bacterium]
MNIEVLFFGQLREITGVSQTNVVIEDNSRLADLVAYLSGQYGEVFREKVESIEGLRILVNGREYYLLGRMEAPLSDGNTVVFLPPIAGG